MDLAAWDARWKQHLATVRCDGLPIFASGVTTALSAQRRRPRLLGMGLEIMNLYLELTTS